LDLAYELRPDLHIVDAYSFKAFGNNIEDKRLEIFSCSNDKKALQTILQGSLEIEKDRYVVLHQAVSWDNRTWPKHYWDVVVKRLLQDGLKIAIIGRKKDFSYELDSRVINLHSQLSLSQIKELIAKSQLFIGPDSGMLHIAMTTITPIIGLFTIADPKLRVTRAENVTSLVPQSLCRFCLHVAKAPVTQLGCRYGTNHCVQEILPQQVISAYVKYVDCLDKFL
jgi:heptosyltransferase-1